jgi:mannose-1-phosphate guanylyltransferase / mannose-6-phosphate isomerase
MQIIPVVLSGGAGTRLWPVSRESHPKPFMLMPDGESLLQKTYARAARVSKGAAPLTITNREYFFSSRDALLEAGNSDQGFFLLEAQGRNTAGAITMAALELQKTQGNDAIMLVLPADHLIQKQDAFEQAVQQAAALAQTGLLVTFGIVPTHPETGFGYIQKGAALAGGHEVARFVEKPPIDVAQAYLASGDYLWNSGMFCFGVGAFLEQMAGHAPAVLDACRDCMAGLKPRELGGAQGLEIPDATYALVPSISIDHALMEKSTGVAVVPADIGWSDIGSWTAVRDLSQADDRGNRTTSETLFIDSDNTYVRGEGRLIATVGTRDLVIVDTPDALLISDAARVQDVREVVALLKDQQHPAYQLHQTVARPWGTYTVLGEGDRYKLKRIEVRPGASLSLQMHHHRNEHWIVVSGVAEVTNGDRVLKLNANESTYIPAEHRHRLTNIGPDLLVMIEVQSGSYLGEDDIVRFEDKYGRTPAN